MSNTFKNILMFKATIPYEFRLEENDYLFTVKTKIDEKLEERVRRFVFHKEDEFIENQKTPSTNSFFSTFNLNNMTYSYNISKVEIQLEIFDDEIKTINDYFSNENNSIMKLSAIFQNLLMMFSRMYNEAMGGVDFFKPIVDFYGPVVCGLYINNSEKSSKCIVTGSYMLKKIESKTSLKITNIIPYDWRLYFNRAKNSYNLYDNIDTILFSAISIESYVISLIRDSGLEDDYNMYKKTEKYMSFSKELGFLKKRNVIDEVKKDFLNKVFNNLRKYRNDIVHGNIESPFISREIATSCIDELRLFYDKYEKDRL